MYFEKANISTFENKMSKVNSLIRHLKTPCPTDKNTKLIETSET